MSELSEARIPDAPAIQRLPLLQLILVATIVQSLGVGPRGIRMPVMMGASFAAVGSMVALAGMPGIGLQGIFGATIAAGFFGMIIAPFMSKALSALSLNLLFNILGGAERAAINDCHAHQH